MISVVIPAHLEEKRIAATLDALAKSLKKTSHEIIVVTDNADKTAEKAGKYRNTKTITTAKPTGKGSALNRGFALAKGDILLMYDADGAVPPGEIFKAAEELGKSDVVIGARKAKRPLHRWLAAKTYNLITRFVFGLPYADTQCGFKMFKAKKTADILKQIRSKGFEWDVEFLWLCGKKGLEVKELPVEWRDVPGGPIERKKITNVLLLLCDTLLLRLRL